MNSVMIGLKFVGVILLVLSGLSVVYSFWLLLVALFAKTRRVRLDAVDDSDLLSLPTRFLILIPAHNEELVLDACLTAIDNQDYLLEYAKVIVVADNCDDNTVQIALGHDRVIPWDRNEPTFGGKPNALNWAMERIQDAGVFDALIILDSDTIIERGFLTAMDRAFRLCQDELFAAQGYYGVLNQNDTWRTALMTGALALAHYVRPLAREALGLSTGLKGNGMCFSRKLAKKVRWTPDSLTEDIDLALDIVELYRTRVRFVPDAKLWAQMPIDAEQAKSQRQRWERGRRQSAMKRGVPLLLKGICCLNLAMIDAALDLLFPPLAETSILLGFAGLALMLVAPAAHWVILARCAWLLAVALFMAYIVGGFAVSEAPSQAYKALIMGPFYVLWKVVVSLGARSKIWKRTSRRAMGGKKDNP